MGTSSENVDTILPGEIRKHEQSSIGTSAEYYVFLSHRGPGLKKTFVSHLNEALLRSGGKPFLDAKALEKGGEALKDINQALSGALVHVAIFSKGYAGSKYCLNELCDMVASEKPLIPVFYDVEPENLRNTNDGPYAEAFRAHSAKGRGKNVVKWKAALSKAAARTGFKLRDYDGDTAILVEGIVHAVLDALPTPPPLAPARHPVGLGEPSRNVIDMLHKMGDDVGVVGICGMGGIGKTTLAREVFNQEHAKFGSWCFLSDVKEATGAAVMDLQVRMVGDLLGVDAKKLWWNSADWFDHVRNHSREVFVVIDDISSRQQFDQLIPDLRGLPRGSRVVVTSRERGVLEGIRSDAPQGELYDIAEISYRESLDLFVWYAFRTNSIDCVDASLCDYVEEIVKGCNGLPLALEVMGGFLSGKRNMPDDEVYWREATAALRKSGLRKKGDFTSSLRINYDGLVEEEKLMFLDIACFMLGHPKRVAVEVWESSGRYGSSSWSLSRLIEKCLVKVEGGGELSMHDLLRDMGRNVVRETASYKPEMQSHVWDPSDGAKVLQKEQGSDEVEALSIIGERSDTVCKAEVYARMRGLRYLLLDGCPVNGDFSNWSEELRWLQWRDFRNTELPATLGLPKLAVLDLANSKLITRIWARDVELENRFPELRMLILRECSDLRELPEQINKLVTLKHMDLEGCGSLEVLPECLGDLTELEHLNLSKCKRLTYLPESIVRLRKLRELCLRSTGLRKLPVELGRLENLAVFDAAETAIDELPESFIRMQGLQEIALTNCKLLRHLNEDFGCLRSLCRLDLHGCSSLSKLPDSISNFSNLEELYLDDCKLLTSLPPSVCGLKELQVFTMMALAVRELPLDFGQLQSLTELSITDCQHLENLPEQFGFLSSLRKLTVYRCERLSKLPDSFSNLSNLEELEICHCALLTSLPPSVCGLRKLRKFRMRALAVQELPEDFDQLQKLTELLLTDCQQLQNLSEQFGFLSSLQKLAVYRCETLTMIPDSFSNLSNLEEFDIDDCKVLTSLPPSVCGLKKLRVFRMRALAVRELPEDFGQLQSLTELSITDCWQLQGLPDQFGFLNCLQKLTVYRCETLTKIPDSYSNLSNLEELVVDGCKLLTSLPPSVCGLKKLRKFRMRALAVRELPEDFVLLQSLAELKIAVFGQLQNLPKHFGFLSSLQKLTVYRCERLSKIPDSFSNLSNLEELDIDDCKVLTSLPSSVCGLKKLIKFRMRALAMRELPEDFGLLQSLTELKIADCGQLQNLSEQFGSLGNLQKLKIGGCGRLSKLPDSFSNLSNLEVFKIYHCALLTSIPALDCWLKKLRVFRMRALAVREVPKDYGQLPFLTELSITECGQLQNLPDQFGSLSSLQMLTVYRCETLTKLPDSFSNLSNLEELVVDGCKLLTSLPPSVCGLKKLRKFRMRALAVRELPEDFGQLQSLIELEIRDCWQLQNLPDQFGSLSSLQMLTVCRCETLTKIPDSFSNLSNLEELVVDGCKLLTSLPPSVCGLKKLRKFRMRALAVRELPEDFGLVQSLTKLKIADCGQLQNLSEQFGSLGNLQKLKMGGCGRLSKLPDSFSNLSNLEELEIYHCALLTSLPPSVCGLKKLRVFWMMALAVRALPEDFGQLQSLRTLDISLCQQLQTLPERFGSLSSLQKLTVYWCDGLTKLPDSFSNLSNLEELDVDGCKLLTSLPPSVCGLKKLRVFRMRALAVRELSVDFGLLQSLTELSIRECEQLQTLPDYFGFISCLQKLRVYRCERLTKLPGYFSNFSNLEELDIDDCKVLSSLPPSVCGLKKLRKFRMRALAVRELPEDFGQLQSLIELEIRDCWQLQSLPDQFASLSSVQKLTVCRCETLTKIPDSFSNLSNLEELVVDGCKLLTSLPPSVCGLKKLRKFRMRALAVRELPEDFGLLQSLTELKIADCGQLQNLSEQFGSLGNLQKLKMGGCGRLSKLPDSFSNLSNLEELEIHHCALLTSLPPSVCGLKKLRVFWMMALAVRALPEDFGQLQSLRTLYICLCQQLQTLPERFGSLSSLQKLTVYWCDGLTKLPDSFSNLSNLEELDVDGCKLLTSLPPSVCGLKKLRVFRMRALAVRELPEDFGLLHCLTELFIRDCEQLQTLSEHFRSLSSLQRFNVDGCGSLTELAESFSN